MKLRLLLTTGILLTCLFVNAQTQTAVIKDPAWNFTQTYDANFAAKVDLTNNTTAMMVNVPDQDFAVACVTDKLATAWITPLKGFPMSIGKFKGKVLVIAAADRSYFKSFANTFTGYLLDERSGKVLSEKEIYKGSDQFVEQPQFYHAEDGSFFKMSFRRTALKRKVHVGLPLIGGLITTFKMERDFFNSTAFGVIDFDNELNQMNAITPELLPGDSWIYSCSADGSFVTGAVSMAKNSCSIAIYAPGGATPLKTVTFPVYLHPKADNFSFKFATSTNPLLNYVALIYTNPSKEPSLTVAALNFKDGTAKTTTEVFDKAHIKQLDKGFIPLNKKFDRLKIDGAFSIDHIKEYNDNLLVSLSTSYIMRSTNGSAYTVDNAVLLNTYGKDLKPLAQQFLPRFFLSLGGEGSAVAYHQHGENIRIIANQKEAIAVKTIYAELDIASGLLTKIMFLPKDDIKSQYYVNTEAVSWLDNSFILPYFERKGIFSKNVDLQYQLLTF